MIYIGTSGWVYADWRERFYPKGLGQKRWLEYYSARFDTVELNATTYRLPTEAQISRWSAMTPPGFLFTVKLSRLITHRRTVSNRVNEFIENFIQRIRTFPPEKVAQLLCQFPPYLQRDDRFLEEFFEKFPRDFRYVAEFRHPSWFVPQVEEILKRYNVGFCIHDHPNSPSKDIVTSTALAYIRFHGFTGLYTGSYPSNVLAGWAKRIQGLSRRTNDVFVYFNNDWEAAAIHDAQALRQLLDC